MAWSTVIQVVADRQAMDTAPLRDAVRGIDEAAKECHQQHKADVEYLQSFFRKTVEQVDTFLAKAEELRLLDGATIDAKLLTASLARCLVYVVDRSSDSIWRFMIESAFMPTSETSYSVTSRDLENEAKAAVLGGIIEPVVVPLEVCKTSRAGFAVIIYDTDWVVLKPPLPLPYRSHRGRSHDGPVPKLLATREHNKQLEDLCYSVLLRVAARFRIFMKFYSGFCEESTLLLE